VIAAAPDPIRPPVIEEILAGTATTAADGSFIVVVSLTLPSVTAVTGLYLKVLQGQTVLTTTPPTTLQQLPPEGTPLPDIEVTIGSPSALPTDGAPSVEVALHELGAQLAIAVAEVQQELGRYPNSLGAFIVDELNVTLPVQVRVSQLGQVLVTVVDGQASAATTGQVQLRIRPVLGGAIEMFTDADTPLATLGELAEDKLSLLAQQRIFSAEDILRVASTAAGRAALVGLNLGVPVDDLVARARLVVLPTVPSNVARALSGLGIRSPDEFVQTDAATVAAGLSQALGQTVKATDVQHWQLATQARTRVPLPGDVGASGGVSASA
jgi:hypothetical protein